MDVSELELEACSLAPDHHPMRMSFRQRSRLGLKLTVELGR